MLDKISTILELTPLDIVLLVLAIVVIYKLFFKRGEQVDLAPPPKHIPPLKRQDMTVEQLLRYNGVEDEHICVALLGKIYDVTRGKDFYGPGGPYGALAGHDGTRALALMEIKSVKNEYDDTSDLTADDLNDAREWEQRFAAKYDYVGKLLKPGEQPTSYDEVNE